MIIKCSFTGKQKLSCCFRALTTPGRNLIAYATSTISTPKARIGPTAITSPESCITILGTRNSICRQFASSSNSLSAAAEASSTATAAASPLQTTPLGRLYEVRGTFPPSPPPPPPSNDEGDGDDDYAVLRVGQYGMVDWQFTTDSVQQYGKLVGDLNPLHLEWTQQDAPEVIVSSPLVQWTSNDRADEKGGDIEQNSISNTAKTVPLVHGMLVASLFTCIIGTLLPGTIYRNQSLYFKHPVYVGDVVRGFVTIQQIRRRKGSMALVTCDTSVVLLSSSSSSSSLSIAEQKKECIRGQATMVLTNKVVKLEK